MEFASPYMHKLQPNRPKIAKRIERTILTFIGKRDIGKALDIGVRNPVSEILEKHFQKRITNTDIDLDVGSLSGQYDTIFCFEILEHLFNPLHFLLEAHKILKKDGRLYLSTPKGKPHFLWTEYHFHEFHKRELINLIERAGFQIVRIEYHRVLPISKGFTGLRPFLRMFLQRKCMVELRK